MEPGGLLPQMQGQQNEGEGQRDERIEKGQAKIGIDEPSCVSAAKNNPRHATSIETWGSGLRTIGRKSASGMANQLTNPS